MILNSHLPIKAWLDPQTARLPGVSPVAIDDWLTVSDAYKPQMRYRRELIASKQGEVFVAHETAFQVCEELRDILNVGPTGGHPLIDAALNVQEDLCILQKQGDQHILTAAVMCFPSSWDVRQKIGVQLRIFTRLLLSFLMYPKRSSGCSLPFGLNSLWAAPIFSFTPILSFISRAAKV